MVALGSNDKKDEQEEYYPCLLLILIPIVRQSNTLSSG